MLDSANERRLRLLVLTHLFHPDSCGGAGIFTDMCHELAGRNIDVTVRCAYPYYPEWKDKSGRNGLRIERYCDHGVIVERYGLFIPWDSRSIWQRCLYEGSYFLSICRSLVDGARFDVVMVFCPLAGSVAFAGLHKMLHRCPLLLCIQDLPADAAKAGGIIRHGWLQKFARGVQRALFNQADVWSSISPVMIERLKELRDHDQPILFMPNWLHQSIAEEIHRLPSKVGQLASQPVRLLYAGNIGTKQGLLDFCKVLQASSAPFYFRIHGDCGMADQVRDWVASRGDRRFSFGPLLEESGFVRALHETDLFVVTEKSGSGASFFPSKMVPAMASGTPTLAVSDPDSPLGHEMRSQGLGPWSSWDRCGEASEVLRSLESRPAEFAAWQHNAVRRSQDYNREPCLALIERTLREMVQDRTLARTRAAASPVV